MKKLLIGALVTGLLSPVSQSIAAPLDKVEQAKEAIEAHVTLTGAEYKDNFTLFSDNFVRAINSEKTQEISLDEYNTLLKEYGEKVFSDYGVEIVKSQNFSNSVIADVRINASLNEALGGASFTQDAVWVFKFDEQGKISRLVEYMDETSAKCFADTDNCGTSFATASTSSGLSASSDIYASWDLGYCNEVTVSNSTSSRVNDWKVTVAMNGSSLEWGWQAKFKDLGSKVEFTKNSWDKGIKAGGSIIFGYCANGNNTPTVTVGRK